MNTPIAIIGAGVAGLSCGRALQRAGLNVRLFDKGRSPGGRIATRRVDTPAGPAQFDHGAQFFTVRDPGFRAEIEGLGSGLVRLWDAAPKENCHVAQPGMSALPKALAAGLHITLSTQVTAIAPRAEGWRLMGAGGAELGVYGAVVLATPAEQASPLLAPIAQHLAAEAAEAVTAPCWAGLFALAEPVKAAAFEPPDHPILAWLACDSAKPGRPGAPQCWVAHAGPAWTRAHLEQSPEAAAAALWAAAADLLHSSQTPLIAQAHRWRFAKVERAAAAPFAWDPELRLGVCGDWRSGPRIENAWVSGRLLAGAVAP